MKKEQFYQRLARYFDFICGDRKQDVEILERIIKKHKKSKGDQLLDVACGTGLEDKYLKKHFDVTGLDLNKGVLDIAKKRNPEITYIIASMSNFKLNKKFDVITCFDAMCYLNNYQQLTKTLKNFYNHLSSEGVLIFYIDDPFLKELRKEKTKVIVNRNFSNNLEVILFEIYQEKGDKVDVQNIFYITERGKTRIEIEPKISFGLFEIKKIKQTLQKLGFKIYLYGADPKTTFTTKQYTKKNIFPIFVCEK